MSELATARQLNQEYENSKEKVSETRAKLVQALENLVGQPISIIAAPRLAIYRVQDAEKADNNGNKVRYMGISTYSLMDQERKPREYANNTVLEADDSGVIISYHALGLEPEGYDPSVPPSKGELGKAYGWEISLDNIVTLADPNPERAAQLWQEQQDRIAKENSEREVLRGHTEVTAPEVNESLTRTVYSMRRRIRQRTQEIIGKDV